MLFLAPSFRPRTRAPAAIAVAGAVLLSACLTNLPALAQAVETADARATIVDELTLEKTEDLNFGFVAGASAGTIQMTAASDPTCVASAGLAHSGECQPAIFVGKGQNGLIVRIRKPAADRIRLTGPGPDMTISNLLLDGNSDLTTVQLTPGFSRFRINSASGFFTFRLGGQLNVGAKQTAGVYTGTFDVDINYD